MTNGIISEFDSNEVTKVRMRFGAEGYLVYVAVQELLYRNVEHRLARDYDAIASETCTDVNVVKGVVEQLGLFELSDTHFTSASINAYFESKKKLSESKARGGYARWGRQKEANAQTDNANAQQKQANVIQEEANARHIDANAQNKQANAQNGGANAQTEKKKVSPTPPIKKNALTGGSKKQASLFEGAGDERQNDTPTDTEIPPNEQKRERIVVPTAKAVIIFTEKYKSLYGEVPYLAKIENTHLRQLLLKLRNQRLQKGMPIDDDSLLKAFKVFLDNINKDWVYDNYSPQTINSKFNEIISQIRNKKNHGATVRIDPKGAATVPRRNADDYDEKDD